MEGMNTRPPHAVVIIGSGFGGLGMAYALRQAGISDFVLLEKAHDLGGTWRENTYPGAACDVPSHLYSFSFERRYPWQHRYGKQAEILEYQRFVANKYDLMRHIRFGVQVRAARFEADRAVWVVTLADGQSLEARTLISAVGQLHRPAIPDIPGLGDFQGRQFHSATWDAGYDFKGKRVAVIGTGASAVQFVPEIARQVAQLHVFQRTPGWVAPKFDKRFSGFEHWLLKTFPWLYDLDRLRIYWLTEALAYAYQGHRWAERLITGMSKLQLRVQVRDPALRRKLTPDYPIGCKRILLTTDWLRALVRPNVEVVTDGVAAVTANGVRTSEGRERPVDAIVFGTGFAATQFLTPMTVTGLDGRDLHQTWTSGAEAYLGMAVSGFPNFFMLYGPNTNVGSGSIIYMLECQQRYLVKLIQAAELRQWAAVDVRPEAQAAFSAEMQQRSAETTFTGSCQSWYKTAEGRNTNNWVGLMREYRRRTEAPDLHAFRPVRVAETQSAP
mgnify:CR=1 FL=1|jgi:cation diffusion facilitator CzcD-associated flavoprotein CzcO